MSDTQTGSPDLSALDASIEAVIDHGRYATSTSGSVDHAQTRFATWCRARGLVALPADPATVGAYLAFMAAGETTADGEVTRRPYALASIRAAKAAIGIAHDRIGAPSPSRDPWVRLVMAGIARSPSLQRSRSMSPLDLPQMRAVMAVAPPPPGLSTIRDQALLLTAAATRWPMGRVLALRRDQVLVRGDRVRLRAQNGDVIELPAPAATALRQLVQVLPDRVPLAFGVRGTDHMPLFLAGAAEQDIATLTATVRQALRKSAGLDLSVRQPLPSLPAHELDRVLLCRDRRGVRWLRDQALLLTAWHLALRGDEVGTLLLQDLRRDDRGYTAWLGRTKNDQLATGTPLSLLPTDDPALDPVKALDAWLAYRRHAGLGPVFCRLDGAQCRAERGVSAGDDVLDIVKQRTTAAGLNGRYGAHSLRIGFVVAAIRSGASVAEIMTVTRQRSPEMVGHYGRVQQAAQRRAPGVLVARSRQDAL